ncbi:MAG: TlpA family protein disulfide reductase [Gemmatimonadetes bacterium]|nr:TlpA family protein disulfide reductase [Gemmatimonadota bacterium]
MRATPSRKPYALALVFLGVLVLVAWFGRGRFAAATVGGTAPDFTAFTLDGSEARLSDYRGKVVLLNIWATWCPPCLEEMPSMQRLYEEFGERDFEILAVSIDAPLGTRDAAGRLGGDLAAFAADLGLTFPILHDPQGRVEDIYRTTGVPESFIVGRDGVVYRRLAGATVWDAPQYRQMILRLLGEDGAGVP